MTAPVSPIAKGQWHDGAGFAAGAVVTALLDRLPDPGLPAGELARQYTAWVRELDALTGRQRPGVCLHVEGWEHGRRVCRACRHAGPVERATARAWRERRKVSCPICGRPMLATSARCAECRNDGMTL